ESGKSAADDQYTSSARIDRHDVSASKVAARDVRHHGDEIRMIADSLCAREANAGSLRDRGRLYVQVIEHLDMVAQKSDRHHYGAGAALELADSHADIGLQPGFTRTAAAALERERPTISIASQRFRHQHRRLGELLDVGRVRSHRDRDAVRGED